MTEFTQHVVRDLAVVGFKSLHTCTSSLACIGFCSLVHPPALCCCYQLGMCITQCLLTGCRDCMNLRRQAESVQKASAEAGECQKTAPNQVVALQATNETFQIARF